MTTDRQTETRETKAAKVTVDCLIDGAVAATLVVITAVWLGGVGVNTMGTG